MPPTNLPRRPLGRGPGAAPQRPPLPPEPADEAPADPAAPGAESSHDAPAERRSEGPEPSGPRPEGPSDTGLVDPAPEPGPPTEAPDAGGPPEALEAPEGVSERPRAARAPAGPPTPSGAAGRAPDASSGATVLRAARRGDAPHGDGGSGNGDDGGSGNDGARDPERTSGFLSEGDEASDDGADEAAGAAGADDVAPGGADDVAPAGSADAAVDGGAARDEGADSGRFTVRLANFEGPFDLLLQLIAKHKLDVTEVALSKVTDEFMAHIRAMGPDWDLDQTTEFLVVAATLLDLKAARLLPAAEVEDEADLALLEARDLLFARLLQYRAYKEVAAVFTRRLDEEGRRYPRTVGLEPGLAELLPDVVIRIGPEGFARLAVKAMQPKPEPQVYVDHIHAPLVSVQEQAQIVVDLLRERGRATFHELTADTDDTLTVVARFLALLELYRARAVGLDQEEALGALVVHWTGGEDAGDIRVGEFDLVSGTGEQEEATA